MDNPGACFTNDFLFAIQIWWQLCLAVIPLLAIRLQQIFVHATTAVLSCHVHNFVAIAVLELKWEWNKISIEFEKNGSEMGPWPYTHLAVRWLTTKSQEISKQQAIGLELCDHSEIWLVSWQQCCRGTCKISEQYVNFNIQSHGIDTWDLVVRCLAA